MYCPNCGAENEGAAKFCANCGTTLGTGPVNRPATPSYQQSPVYQAPPFQQPNYQQPPGVMGGGGSSVAKNIGIGCLIAIALFFFVGLSCTRACLGLRRASRIIRYR